MTTPFLPTPTVGRRHGTGAAGFSLVECLLAMGLLTAVLLSVSGLFMAGSKSVKSGRELTKATTIANSAMEQVLGWPYEKVYGFSGAIATNQTRTWLTSAANPAYVGSALDVAEWTTTANAWRDEVEAELEAGVLTYRVDGMARLPVAGNPGLETFLDAQFIRVTVTVEWMETGKRRRQVTFEEIVL